MPLVATDLTEFLSIRPFFQSNLEFRKMIASVVIVALYIVVTRDA